MKYNFKTSILLGSIVVALSIALPVALGSTAGATGSRHESKSKNSEHNYHQKDKSKQGDRHKKDEQQSHKHKDKSDDHKHKSYQKDEQKKHYQRNDDHKRDDNHKKKHDDKKDQVNRHLHRKLDSLLREHAAVGVAALKADIKNAPEAASLKRAVEANSKAIAKIIDQIYPDTRNDFLRLWRQHIQYYVQYLHAADEGDEEGQEEAKHNLARFVDRVTHLLNRANKRLDEHRLKHQMTMHGEQVTMIIDKLVVEEDEQAAQRLAHQAVKHMSALADTLALSKSHQH